MSDDLSLPASEEYDFSNDTQESKDVVVTVTGFDINDKDGDGEKIQHVLTFGGDALPFPVKVQAWVKHPNEVAQRIGRSTLRKIALKLTGQPRYSASSIVGATGLAKFGEDKDGFMKLTNFRSNQSQVSLG